MSFHIRGLFVSLFVFIYSIGVFAQEKSIGVVYGNGMLGKGKLSGDYRDVDFNSLELRYQIENREKKYRLHILEGFEGVFGSETNLGYLKTGFGADVIDGGERLFFVLGLGIHLKVLVLNQISYREFKRLYLGMNIHSGFGVRISSSFAIDILCQYQFGVTPAYISYRQSPGGAMLGVPVEEIGERESELFIKVGIHYLFKSSK